MHLFFKVVVELPRFINITALRINKMADIKLSKSHCRLAAFGNMPYL